MSISEYRDSSGDDWVLSLEQNIYTTSTKAVGHHGKGGGKNLRPILRGESSLLGMKQSLHQWTQSGYGYLH